jgi:hypothetical protein
MTEEMTVHGFRGDDNTDVLSGLLYDSDELRPEEPTTRLPLWSFRCRTVSRETWTHQLLALRDGLWRAGGF